MSIRIRRGVRADVGVLQEIELDAGVTFGEVGMDAVVADGASAVADFERALGEGVLLVAEEAGGGAVVGFLMVWRVDGTAHLREMDVLRRARGLGLGRALIAAGEAWAREAGYKECTLTTFADVAWNGPFYGRLGYEVFAPGAAGYGELGAMLTVEGAHFAGHARVAMRKVL